jgi:hypothetical protein
MVAYSAAFDCPFIAKEDLLLAFTEICAAFRDMRQIDGRRLYRPLNRMPVTSLLPTATEIPPLMSLPGPQPVHIGVRVIL